MEYVFVYGTLKKGFFNHKRIEGEQFIGEAYLKGYNMYSLTVYPFIYKGDGTIKGELYRVRDETMPIIDSLEAFYTKRTETVELPNGETYEAFCYVFEDEQIKEDIDDFKKVEGNEWR